MTFPSLAFVSRTSVCVSVLLLLAVDNDAGRWSMVVDGDGIGVDGGDSKQKRQK